MVTITVDRVSRCIDDIRVLNETTLDIPEGEFVSLVGPSGCGKSTLLAVIAGAVRPDSGQIRIDGLEPHHRHPDAGDILLLGSDGTPYPSHFASRKAYRSPQMWRLNARSSDMNGHRVPPHASGVKRTIDDAIGRAAGAIGVRELLRTLVCPPGMSGAHGARRSSRRTMPSEGPSAVLLDDPFAGCDPGMRAQTVEAILGLQRRSGVSLLYATRDLAEAMSLSDRIAMMFDGEIVQVDSPMRIYDDPEDLRVARYAEAGALNVLPGTVADGGIECFGLRLPAHVRAATGTRILMTVRPDSLLLDGEANPGLVGRIIRTARSGPFIAADATIDGTCHTIRFLVSGAASRGLATGQVARLSVCARDIFLFDLNGRRIRHIVPALAGGYASRNALTPD